MRKGAPHITSSLHACPNTDCSAGLEDCTEAIYEIFSASETDRSKAPIVDKLLHTGLSGFYKEVLSESDLFDESPVRPLPHASSELILMDPVLSLRFSRYLWRLGLPGASFGAWK